MRENAKRSGFEGTTTIYYTEIEATFVE